MLGSFLGPGARAAVFPSPLQLSVVKLPLRMAQVPRTVALPSPLLASHGGHGTPELQGASSGHRVHPALAQDRDRDAARGGSLVDAAGEWFCRLLTGTYLLTAFLRSLF